MSNIDTAKWEIGTGKVFTAVENAIEYFIMREGDDVAIASDIIDPDTEQPSAEYAQFILNACTQHNILETENAKMKAAIQTICHNDDYCIVCDNHPSSGHSDDCPMQGR